MPSDQRIVNESLGAAMPERKSGEKLSDFIGRFVGAKKEKKKFPDRKQRLAVGFAEALAKKRKAA
jgi:hypothetical protein